MALMVICSSLVISAIPVWPAAEGQGFWRKCSTVAHAGSGGVGVNRRTEARVHAINRGIVKHSTVRQP